MKATVWDTPAAQLHVLLSLVAPTVVLASVAPGHQLLVGGAAFVALTAAIAMVHLARTVLLLRPVAPLVRSAQTATFTPVCRCITLPQDPIRPRAPGLV
ncbi:hypothetical protein [Calidifontibacter indicus]|uniref:hypothetical protein n=1 Tax=Calidifontibacter indicus TaxID=419650 RepID=UPI003D740790